MAEPCTYERGFPLILIAPDQGFRRTDILTPTPVSLAADEFPGEPLSR
jgi:hypothetical protein